MNGDLAAQSENVWISPPQPYVNDVTTLLGLTVAHVNGNRTLSHVRVRFFAGDPAHDGIQIGEGIVPLLGARDPGQNTLAVSWTPPTVGAVTLYAIIDPDNQVTETNENNNIISRTVTVHTATADTFPPQVESFTIDDGAASTVTSTVTLTTIASDLHEPSTGVASLRYIEFTYREDVGQWIPLQQSDWLSYTDSPLVTLWQLDATPGVKYIQAWAADVAGNISLEPASAAINYVPLGAQLDVGNTHFYRQALTTGEHFTATLTLLSGDADIYVWGPDNTLVTFSNGGTNSVDSVDFVASAAGVYQIEVYGYTAADYELTMGSDLAAHRMNGSLTAHPSTTDPSKTIPTSPLVPVTSSPYIPMADYRLYVPLIQR